MSSLSSNFGKGKLPGQKGIKEALPLVASDGGAGALFKDIEFLAVAPADCKEISLKPMT